MSKPKIVLGDKLQEAIAFNQEDDCAAAKATVARLEEWMSTLINGHPIQGEDDAETIQILQALNTIKLDYQSFYAE